LSENIEVLAGKEIEERKPSEADLQAEAARRISQYRRDIYPQNIVLSAEDLVALCELLLEANERAKNIEFNNLNLAEFESSDQARSRVNELVQVEHNYVAESGDSFQGLGIPRVAENSFPAELRSFFVSNAAYTRRAIKVEPLCVVDTFLSFAKPSLKIDVLTFPSNPTENRSVINVYGRDEDWVISTANRIEEYFRIRKTFRPVIHGSGAYDYLIYLVYLPTVFWIAFKKGSPLESLFATQSTLFNVVVGIYLLLVSLLFARFIFQYVRWLFPPMEYYKRSRFGAYTHRVIAGLIGGALFAGAVYDIGKSIVLALFGS